MYKCKGNIRQYESKDAKSNRALFIIIIVLIGVIFYRITKADTKTEVNPASIDNTSNQTQNETIEEEIDEPEEKVLSAQNSYFSVDNFLSDLESTYPQYSFQKEETSFTWHQSYTNYDIEGTKISTTINVGDYKLDTNCKKYLQELDFQISADNAGGSDAGETKQGLSDGYNVCILETKPSGVSNKSLYEISCGNI